MFVDILEGFCGVVYCTLLTVAHCCQGFFGSWRKIFIRGLKEKLRRKLCQSNYLGMVIEMTLKYIGQEFAQHY